ncbi:restriction endonuclease subunit S [Acidithiobacillus ferrooxidans]|uniref:restriction endonuclease subunit S n=1 Tax=Acidithiobacillus ferrooxidans TaxID=920 RepID=UPI00214AF7B3|nr:restriction endonuclease subunit S [Acidithiobacillus ferrooxidans]MCR2830618.1 restriction endonuclease subunit S [Acidithiobacillus ferrooxidans]
MTYPRYPKHRDSGVEWLGDVPEGWGVKKVGFCCDFYTGWTPPTGDESSYDGDLPWANISDIGPKFLTETAKRISMSAVRKHKIRIAPNGSLLFSIKLSVGQVSIAAVPMYTNEAIAIFQSSANILSRWAYYTVPICIPKNASENIYGAKMLNQYLIKSAKIVLPPIEEQHAIAAFLDAETARIDALIAEYETLIELLKEKRQALISQAVTKGLNPDVPMKDSGVEWLGEVPEGWKPIPLHSMSSDSNSLFIDGDWIESKDLSDTGIRYITTGNVGEGFYKEQGAGFISEETFVDLRCTKVKPGDILISHLNIPIGRSCIIPEFFGYMVTSVDNVIFRPDRDFSRQFITYMLSSKAHLANMENLARGTTMQRISRSTLGSAKFCMPPPEEQHAIVAFLDAETARMDTLVQEAENGINLLRERRMTLISDAVTGKIDVRDWKETM